MSVPPESVLEGLIQVHLYTAHMWYLPVAPRVKCPVLPASKAREIGMKELGRHQSGTSKVGINMVAHENS